MQPSTQHLHSHRSHAAYRVFSSHILSPFHTRTRRIIRTRTLSFTDAHAQMTGICLHSSSASSTHHRFSILSLSQLYVLLLFLLCAPSLCASSHCTKSVNGCSTPSGTPFKKEFTPYCNRHDLCYTCASACFGDNRRGGRLDNADRRFCDRTLRNDLDRYCRNTYPNCAGNKCDSGEAGINRISRGE